MSENSPHRMLAIRRNTAEILLRLVRCEAVPGRLSADQKEHSGHDQHCFDDADEHVFRQLIYNSLPKPRA